MERLYHIDGTHCTSCQILLEQRLNSIPGISRARVDWHTGKASIHVSPESPPDEAVIARAVAGAGYRLVTAPIQRTFLSHRPTDWADALTAACIVFVLYLVYRLTGLNQLGAGLSAASTAGGALVVGLIAGVSTCMALIGSLVLASSARHAQQYPYATAWQRIRPNLVFNAGRIAGFAMLGGIAGLAGSAFSLDGRLLGILVVLAGVMMVTVGIKLTGLMPRLEQLALPASVARLVGLDRASGGHYSHGRTALTGILTFFLPCAFTQTVQVLAISTGSFLQGAAIMSAFALGTMPGLIGIGSIAGFAKGESGRMFMKVAGIAVLLLGIWNVGNGWNLTGITIGTGASAAIGTTGAQLPEIRDGEQILPMSQWAGGYNPNKLTVRAGIPVRWEISADGTGCASYLMVPSLGIRKSLQPGMNVVQFTPKRVGTIKFSCGMGMYTGSIAVVK